MMSLVREHLDGTSQFNYVKDSSQISLAKCEQFLLLRIKTSKLAFGSCSPVLREGASGSKKRTSRERKSKTIHEGTGK
jgi:hypothetical protein